MDVCIAKSGDTLDLASSDSRWLQRQHRLEDGVEFCYARHGRDVRRLIDTAYFSRFQLCLCSRNKLRSQYDLAPCQLRQVMPFVFAIEVTKEKGGVSFEVSVEMWWLKGVRM